MYLLHTVPRTGLLSYEDVSQGVVFGDKTYTATARENDKILRRACPSPELQPFDANQSRVLHHPRSFRDLFLSPQLHIIFFNKQTRIWNGRPTALVRCRRRG